MTNSKATKRALLTSVISLMLCFAMLLGTTFAWFTDNASSVNNVITSGNLDVELEYSTDFATWNKVKADTNIFKENALWEPGYTEVVYLRVSNVGNLAMKYNLGVKVASEKPGKTRDGDKEFKLSNFIEYGVVTDVTSPYEANTDAGRTAAKNAVATPVKLNTAFEQEFNLDGKTATVTDSDTYALVVYMPESVTNEANHNGKDIPEINLGLFVNATQLDAELDSFGSDYDKDAVYYDTLVTTAEELYDAVANAEKSSVIAIDGNIKLTKALSNNGLENIKFVAFGKNAVIDQATYNMHFKNAKVTFEGLTLTHGEKAYGNGGQTSTAFAVWDASEVNYINCTFNRSVGTIHAKLHNFIGCTFNGVENPNNSKSEYPLYICDGQDYNVTDCVFNCTNRGAILFYNDGGNGVDTLNISNTKFLGDIIAEKTAVEIHNNSKTQVYNVNIKDVVVGNGIINGLYRIKPGNQGEVNVNVDDDSVITGATLISTADQLVALGGTKVKGTYILTANVDMKGKTMKSMELSGGATVNFIGNGHSISNLDLGAAGIHGMTGNGNEVAGLFDLSAPATTVSLTVSDLVIKKANVKCNGYAAAIVGYNSNSNTTITLNNVDVEGAEITAETVAALVGYTTGKVTLNGCDVSDLTLTGETGRPEKVGAYVGTANTATCVVNVADCTNNTTYNDYGRVINGATYN